MNQTGFYYFIFANENEITDNFLHASFSLNKTVFDVSANVLNCTNTTQCQLPLGFWSQVSVNQGVGMPKNLYEKQNV